ncbi:hypothetical protein GCM10010383_01220 [Streptomyces lomondensis]|uniref:Uncharacterized protein n=1 Tax=Streptomyces lomondensis TaxID=68229 RepID=A0ABQ2WTU2_9ACTN|nr:hypothetical protein GCM10010383_01220 [Streptomyces lomondensis]
MRAGHRLRDLPAEDAADALRKALADLGLPENVWDGIRPMVTQRGTPYVHLGMVRADVAEKMAEAMRTPAEAVVMSCGRTHLCCHRFGWQSRA